MRKVEKVGPGGGVDHIYKCVYKCVVIQIAYIRALNKKPDWTLKGTLLGVHPILRFCARGKVLFMYRDIGYCAHAAQDLKLGLVPGLCKVALKYTRVCMRTTCVWAKETWCSRTGCPGMAPSGVEWAHGTFGRT